MVRSPVRNVLDDGRGLEDVGVEVPFEGRDMLATVDVVRV